MILVMQDLMPVAGGMPMSKRCRSNISGTSSPPDRCTNPEMGKQSSLVALHGEDRRVRRADCHAQRLKRKVSFPSTID